jgi:hypothetical protein
LHRRATGRSRYLGVSAKRRCRHPLCDADDEGKDDRSLTHRTPKPDRSTRRRLSDRVAANTHKARRAFAAQDRPLHRGRSAARAIPYAVWRGSRARAHRRIGLLVSHLLLRLQNRVERVPHQLVRGNAIVASVNRTRKFNPHSAIRSIRL